MAVFVHTRDRTDYQDVTSPSLTYLPAEFKITANDFKTASIPSNSVIIMDDFYFTHQSLSRIKQDKTDFLHVVNYTLRHNQVTLFLIVHNLYNSNLATDMLLSTHLFVSYSNVGYSLVRKLAPRLGGNAVLDFYQKPFRSNYHWAYINTAKCYLINCIETLFQTDKTGAATMFVNDTVYVIHPADELCVKADANASASSNISSDNVSIQDKMNEFFLTAYPKNKILPLVFKNIVAKQLVDHDLFFVKYPSVHVADFCSFINNKFGKESSSNVTYIKLCKFLKAQAIKFPHIIVKNPIARPLL